MLTLGAIDDLFTRLNLRSIDGEKPSSSFSYYSRLKSSSTWLGLNHIIKEKIKECILSLSLFSVAMQMWTLARFLPLAIGHIVPEGNEYWENFLHLLDIMDVLFARCIPTELCGYLISDHHSTFRSLYPNVSITLKMHSMVHMPRLIMQSVSISSFP